MTREFQRDLHKNPEELLIGLLQDGGKNPEDYPLKLREAGIALNGNYFCLVGIQVVPVDIYAFISATEQNSITMGSVFVEIQMRLKKLFEKHKEVYVFHTPTEIWALICAESVELIEKEKERAL